MVNISQFQQAIPGFNFKNGTLGDVINVVLPYLFGIAGLVLLFYLVMGGFSWMLSGGDPKAIESAKGKITTAITGFVILFVAYWLMQLLGLVLGIQQFKNIFGQ